MKYQKGTCLLSVSDKAFSPDMLEDALTYIRKNSLTQADVRLVQTDTGVFIETKKEVDLQLV